MYSASAAEVWGLFGDYVTGNADASVLVIGAHAPSEAARNALDKSFAALGYGSGACAYAALNGQTAGASGVGLDAQAVFMLVEGLDPICVVCCDEASIAALEGCYRTSFVRDNVVRAFGRPAALFADFEGLLGTDDGKQHAWRILKALPHMA